MEPTMNQYAAPTADVADVVTVTETARMDLFSYKERIGRLRYLAYLVGGGLVINIATAILVGIAVALMPSLVFIFSVVALIPSMWFSAITGIKRAHDFNASGWWCLVALLPNFASFGMIMAPRYGFAGGNAPLIGGLLSFAAALAFVFIPGNKGANNYGPPPPPNTWGVRVLALILPVIAIIGILAAVAIPQYKAYTDKARASQSPRP